MIITLATSQYPEKVLGSNQVRAGEIPADSLLLGLTWGLCQQLLSRVCCCVPKNIYKFSFKNRNFSQNTPISQNRVAF